MQLTAEEKYAIEFHLGWVMDTQVINVTGIIVDHNVVGMLRRNIENCPEGKVPRTREVLCECEKILNELKGARRRLGVRRLDEAEFDSEQQILGLEREYQRWTDILSDMYGGHKNAFSSLHNRIGNTATGGLMEPYA